MRTAVEAAGQLPARPPLPHLSDREEAGGFAPRAPTPRETSLVLSTPKVKRVLRGKRGRMLSCLPDPCDLERGGGRGYEHRWPSHLPIPWAFSLSRCPGRKGEGAGRGRGTFPGTWPWVLGVALDYPPVTFQ